MNELYVVLMYILRCTVASVTHHLILSILQLLLNNSYLQPNVSQVTYHHSTSYAYPPVPTIVITLSIYYSGAV